MTLTEVRHRLADIGIRPSKAMGQNFLVDANILAIILKQARIGPDETIIEIGPGLGVLTAELIARAGRVIGIEKDRRLCAHLRERFHLLELVQGDAVEVLGKTVPFPDSYKVVANLPYNISTPILERFVEAARKPRAMVITLQREVAARLAARPGTKEYGALTLLTQLYYHASIAHVVSPRCFYPPPHVESAIVVLDRRDPRLKLMPGAPFHQIVRAGFSQRRKMLHKLLVRFGNTDDAFAAGGVAPTARAEELGLDQWIALANAFARAQPRRSSSLKP